MTIHIRHISDVEVEVTLTPGWLGRMFGAKARRGIADRDACDGPAPSPAQRSVCAAGASLQWDGSAWQCVPPMVQR